jgi:hypothetical protein
MRIDEDTIFKAKPTTRSKLFLYKPINI